MASKADEDVDLYGKRNPLLPFLIAKQNQKKKKKKKRTRILTYSFAR